MMRAVQLSRHGGPEVLEVVDLPSPSGVGQVLVEVEAAGVNYIDVYERQGGGDARPLPPVSSSSCTDICRLDRAEPGHGDMVEDGGIIEAVTPPGCWGQMRPPVSTSSRSTRRGYQSAPPRTSGSTAPFSAGAS
jgi:hypothetical protein